jgi:hypothetical protein
MSLWKGRELAFTRQEAVKGRAYVPSEKRVGDRVLTMSSRTAAPYDVRLPRHIGNEVLQRREDQAQSRGRAYTVTCAGCRRVDRRQTGAATRAVPGTRNVFELIEPPRKPTKERPRLIVEHATSAHVYCLIVLTRPFRDLTKSEEAGAPDAIGRYRS